MAGKDLDPAGGNNRLTSRSLWGKSLPLAVVFLPGCARQAIHDSLSQLLKHDGTMIDNRTKSSYREKRSKLRRSAGVTLALRRHMTFSSDLLKKLATTESSLEKNLIRDVKKIFNTIIGMDDLLFLPLSVDPTSHFTDCMSAMVGFAGTYNGLVSLHVSNDLAKKITAGMLDQANEPTEEEVEDALGELTNILAGSFKQHLAKGSLDIRLAIPSVVSGKKYVIHVARKPEVTTLLFALEEDWFMAALALEPG
jgi:chemotaxis protein CheX